MFGHGKCPKCEMPVDHADAEAISVGDRMYGPLYRGISIVCPHCQTILSVAFDPISQKVDIVGDVLEGLGHPRERR